MNVAAPWNRRRIRDSARLNGHDQHMGQEQLFAVCLGGRAAGANVEVHDVVFAVGCTLEDTHGQLLDAWFGRPDELHVDAWAVVDQVPGYRVTLRSEPSTSGVGLYFVNIGGYAPGELLERHAYALYAGTSKSEVKIRARNELLSGNREIHRDDMYDIDDVLEVQPGADCHVHLTADPAAGSPAITNGYEPIPRATIEAWCRARKRGASHPSSQR